MFVLQMLLDRSEMKKKTEFMDYEQNRDKYVN